MNKTPQGLDTTKPMFPISSVADTVKLHQRTLRLWDENNLLSPNRSPKNRRLYSWDDIERAKLINWMSQDLGINLAGIKVIFDLLVVDYDDIQAQKERILEAIETTGISTDNREKLSRRGRKSKAIV